MSPASESGLIATSQKLRALSSYSCQITEDRSDMCVVVVVVGIPKGGECGVPEIERNGTEVACLAIMAASNEKGMMLWLQTGRRTQRGR